MEVAGCYVSVIRTLKDPFVIIMLYFVFGLRRKNELVTPIPVEVGQIVEPSTNPK